MEEPTDTAASDDVPREEGEVQETTAEGNNDIDNNYNAADADAVKEAEDTEMVDAPTNQEGSDGTNTKSNEDGDGAIKEEGSSTDPSGPGPEPESATKKEEAADNENKEDDLPIEATEETKTADSERLENEAVNEAISGDKDDAAESTEEPTKEDEMEVDNPEENAADDAASSEGKAEDATGNGSHTDEASSNDLPYSTRGRSTGGSASGEEKSEKALPRETFEELPKAKEPSLGVSFLESLSEEERRTRTRFVPDVEGMHTLRKNEVKEDIALARSLPTIASSSTNLQTRTARLAGSSRKKDAMVVEGEDLSLVVQDARTTTVDLPNNDITVPCDAFVAPEGVVVGEMEGTIAVKDVSKKEPAVQSPAVIESVTAFNPPRPPESVGPKKRHRVIRWERRPEDIEVDMKNYRRTVQRTREELQKSEAEYDRLETIDAHLRRHFLNHLELLNHEYKRLHDEMQIEVQKLMKESELVGSRTRSRNLTKVSVVMRDVLNSLNAAPMTDEEPPNVEVPPTAVPGIGGLNVKAFDDWDRSTEVKPMKPAISWLEPGQQVSTLYGDGTVEAVFPPEVPDSSADENSDTASSENQRAAAEEMRNADFQKSSNRKKGTAKASGKDEEKIAFEQEHSKYTSLKPLRVQIRLPYGVGVFGIDVVRRMDSPANYSDAKLAKRWRGMIDSALKVGYCIDLQGMSSKPEKQSPDTLDGVEGSAPMDLDDVARAGQVANSDMANAEEDAVLPIGASLFPTKGGRGNFLHKMSITDIEKGLQRALYDGHGVLGKKSNPGVTKDIREWEDDEQEYLTLSASVLQLKNALYRQRRIRVLNERTSASMNDRYQRAEDLVSEMRSDLKSLKRRLEEELNELGITEDMANQILSSFYQGHSEDDLGDASTPKRLKRTSSVSREMLVGADLSNAESGGGDPRDSMDDGTDELSGDDLEAHQPAKKLRTSQ
eukprot:CAMPEP_0178822378 /NCGR_PEP_ID=MMETSP0746-20121128/4564_1 /TAXON_ID=913974 /ORGANISM="Nitzschia punctata, Strain CCMP561" /LENGTH=948 /DNA_ID=CAMNT_0020483887 /DNA_START=199 /DNA_END=3046 /DNA_ORIENTATION=-